MFDGLKEPDGPIKLLPDFCILSGSLELPLACSSHIGCYKRCQRGRGGRRDDAPLPFSVNRTAEAELSSTCAWSGEIDDPVSMDRDFWLRKRPRKDRFLIQSALTRSGSLPSLHLGHTNWFRLSVRLLRRQRPFRLARGTLLRHLRRGQLDGPLPFGQAAPWQV